MDTIIANNGAKLDSTKAKRLDEGSIKAVSDKTRRDIIVALAKNPMFPLQIAKNLKIHEQKVYYHLKVLESAGLTEVIEKKEIRGTIAKKYRATATNFSIILNDSWKRFKTEKRSHPHFFEEFIEHGKFNAKIVVGSPDPHGPHKARARDGHYAIELGLFMGGMGSLDNDFSVSLDVDINLKNTKSNLIVVGGPVTNLVTAELNRYILHKFSDNGPWGIIGRKTYTDEAVGMITKIPNPYNPSLSVMIIAGIRFIGTKSAVIGITKATDLVLSRYNRQKRFCAIVQGFDTNADGKIDDIELLD